jgi:hypothetical protein
VGLVAAIAVLAALGCGRRSGGGAGDLGTLRASLSATDDIASVRVDVLQGTTVVATKTITPTPGGTGGTGAGGDAFFVLPPGSYSVTATPLDATGAPSSQCSVATVSATVATGVTTEVTLVIFCQGSGSGGLDVVITTTHGPVITDLTFDPSKFTETCSPVGITVTAEEAGGAQLTYAWSISSEPAGAVATLTPSGPSAKLLAETPGDYTLVVVVSDPQMHTASLSFPVHVLPGPVTDCGGGDPIRGMFTHLEATVVTGGLMTLVPPLGAARASYENGDPCGAVMGLEAVMAAAQQARDAASQPAADDAFNEASGLRASILALRAAAGGCPSAPTFGASPRDTVMASDATQLVVHFDFGEALFSTFLGGGQTFSEVEVPGIDAMGGQPGTPAVPIYRRLFAIPVGAQAQLTFAKPAGGRLLHLHVAPIQNQAVDQAVPPGGGMIPKPDPSTFLSPPFVQDAAAYASPVAIPPGPCRIDDLGQVRDLHVAQLSCGAGQYVAASDTLTLFDGIDVGVDFTGGQGGFQTKRAATDPFEAASQATTGVLLNGPATTSLTVSTPIVNFLCAGEELLILTPAAFAPAANALAAWKNSKGITTSVATVDDGMGGYLTAAADRQIIDRDYGLCTVRPSYVLLLGDAGFIPPFYFEGIGTDYPYAVYPRPSNPAPTTAVTLPDFAVARMPATSLDEANTMVNKVIDYEKTPPSLADFYQNVTIASYFQAVEDVVVDTFRDKRTFVHVSEQMRAGLLDLGYSVQRIDTRDHVMGYATPSEFDDGTALTSDIGAASGFPWTGNTTDIVNAWQAGRFLIFHRDHGWPDGWGNPDFETANAGALTNGSLLPVVFSVNCASGYFDDETDGTGFDTPHFTETLLRNPNGGAVAVIGDTRNSPSWENSVLSRGYFDAVFPSILSYGGITTAHPRLGDILNYGKGYLANQEGAGNVYVIAEFNLYHAFGDPTQEIWTANPHVRLILPPIYQIVQQFPPMPLPGPDPGPYIEVSYAADGATLTAYQQGDNGAVIPIARGVAQGGRASLIGVQNLDPTRPLFVSASLAGSVSQPLQLQ